MKIQTRVDRDTRPDTIERDSFSSKVDERGVSNISGLKTAERSQRVKTTSAHRGGKGNKRKRKKKAKLATEQSVSLNETKQQEKSESSVQTAVDTSVHTASEIICFAHRIYRSSMVMVYLLLSAIPIDLTILFDDLVATNINSVKLVHLTFFLLGDRL